MISVRVSLNLFRLKHSNEVPDSNYARLPFRGGWRGPSNRIGVASLVKQFLHPDETSPVEKEVTIIFVQIAGQPLVFHFANLIVPALSHGLAVTFDRPQHPGLPIKSALSELSPSGLLVGVGTEREKS